MLDVDCCSVELDELVELVDDVLLVLLDSAGDDEDDDESLLLLDESLLAELSDVLDDD